VADGNHLQKIAPHQPAVDGGEEQQWTDRREQQQQIDGREREVPQHDAQCGGQREKPGFGEGHAAMRHRAGVMAVFDGIDDIVEEQAHDAGGDAGEQKPAADDDDRQRRPIRRIHPEALHPHGQRRRAAAAEPAIETVPDAREDQQRERDRFQEHGDEAPVGELGKDARQFGEHGAMLAPKVAERETHG